MERNGNEEALDVVEVFLIHAEDFCLWATLISFEDGESKVSGWARYGNGERTLFFSKDNDPSSLRDRLLSACRSIAAFYGVELLHKKIRASAKERDEYPFLVQGGGMVH